MERYRMLDHAADGKFRAFGETLEEAFGNAALAVAGQMWDWTGLKPARSVPVSVEGRDLPQLLYRFLEEVLYLFETQRFLLAAVEDTAIEDAAGRRRLKATFRGVPVSDGTEIFGDVKAVTYHDMKIESACGRWTVQVVVDR